MKTKVAIIFGSNGQDGYYLKDLIAREKVNVICISRSSGDYIGSIGDFEFVEKIIKSVKPYYIFHLAANSTTNHSALNNNHDSISTGAINILEACRKYSPYSKIFLCGSALQFKNDGIPINESTVFEPSSAYSVSRIHATYLARYFRKEFGIKVYIGYLFNHDSPFRSENHLNQKIVETAIKIYNGNITKLKIGDIDARKEFNYAGDIVSAIWSFIKQDSFFEVVIGSGIAYSIKEWIIYSFTKLDLDWENFIEKDELFVSEYKILISDPQLIKSIGWEPEVDFYKLADMMLSSSLKKLAYLKRKL